MITSSLFHVLVGGAAACPRAKAGMPPAPGLPVWPQHSRKHLAGQPPVNSGQAAARVPYAAYLAGTAAGLALLHCTPGHLVLLNGVEELG